MSEPVLNEVTMTLSDRMKMYERENNMMIPKDHYYIVRLDGVSFSKFTKRFHKPFDEIFVNAMKCTMCDLVDKYKARTGYCHSDEITLIFDKCEDLQTHIYNGKIQKITSIMAGYCSVRFNWNLNVLIRGNDTYDAEFINLIQRYEQCFDARIISFAELGEVTNHLIWRSVHDCERNAINTYAHNIFGHKNIERKNCDVMKEMLLTADVDWTNVPLHIKHGLYCKKVMHEKVVEGITCQRSKLEIKCFKIAYSDEMNKLLINKYWMDVPDIEMFEHESL